MSLIPVQAEFLLDACSLIKFATGLGFTVTGGELFRTVEQQKIYFQSGRSKTMDSDHIKRCAIDLNFFKEGQLVYDREQLEPIGRFWESLRPGKNRWGGHFHSFKDLPHFERHRA